MDEITELRKEIAYRRHKLTGCEDSEINWEEAGKILLHFIYQRPKCSWWKADDEDYSVYKDLIYGTDEPGTARSPARSCEA
jgi:hypothetical protein